VTFRPVSNIKISLDEIKNNFFFQYSQVDICTADALALLQHQGKSRGKNESPRHHSEELGHNCSAQHGCADFIQ